MHSFCTKLQQTDWDVSNNNRWYGKAYGRCQKPGSDIRQPSFEHHIKSLCSRLNGSLSYINRIKNTLDEKSRILLINALIFSRLCYCSSIWVKCHKTLQYEVQKCIKFASKVGSNGKYVKRDHLTPLLLYMKWINFSSILRLDEAARFYRYKSVRISMQIQMWKRLTLTPGTSKE